MVACGSKVCVVWLKGRRGQGQWGGFLFHGRVKTNEACGSKVCGVWLNSLWGRRCMGHGHDARGHARFFG
jgi:hypothetical protein